MKQIENIISHLQCPLCKGSLSDFPDHMECGACKKAYAKEGGKIFFIGSVFSRKDSAPSKDIKNFFKRWPNFYHWIAFVFGPAMYTGLSPKKFLEKYPSKTMVFNMGSGPRIINSDCVNMDLFPYKNVDIVADILHMPLKDKTVSRIICDTVVEHLASPSSVLKECGRVLSDDGLAYITAPFLYPYHSSPDDFFRWTKQGFIKELDNNGLEAVETDVRIGPLSVLTVYASYIFALLFSFGSDRLFWILVNASIFIFFPIKILDFFVARMKNAEHLSSVLYYVVKKKSNT